MTTYIRRLTPLLFIFLMMYGTAGLSAQKGTGKGGGQPPAKVITDTLKQGRITPVNDFTGTIYYREVSNLAAEISGKVKELYFEDGMKVKKGHVLISINSDTLVKEIEAKKAARDEVLSELKKAESDLKRATELHVKKLLSDQDFDTYKFTVDGLKSRSRSLKAEIERLEIERGYKSIRAPFDGIIMRKKVERGDWVNPGTVVATLGNDSEMYLLVNVPQEALPFIKKERPVKVRSGGRVFNARVHAVVPQGDVRTRTFPVKVRLAEGSRGLYEGMEGSVSLPVAKSISGLLINRDAITSVMGTVAVYAVLDGKAVMIPVAVSGYKGLEAGLVGAGLKAGMKIVIKGNERLRPGQPVIITNKGK